MVIFLIGTEHQFFQVLEVIKFLKCSQKECILIFENNGNENRFIDELNKNYNFQNVFLFQPWLFKDLVLNRNLISLFLNICKKIKNTNNISFYYSHYDTDSTLLFLSIVKPKFSYLLDEGTASFSVVHYRKKRTFFNLKLILKSILYLRLIQLPTKINYFTKFNLPISNSYDTSVIYNIEKKINNQYPIEKSKIYFLGSSISDIGYMKEDVYINLIKLIMSKFNYEIHYFAHRKENISKLQKISSLGILVHKNELPFEKYFLQLSVWPEYLASFHFSNILDSIITSHANVPNCLLFKFDKNYISRDRDVYEYIFNHNFLNKDLEIIYLDI